jgi:hypothetical protein
VHSAGEFYNLSTNIPSVVKSSDTPRLLWLRRAFGEWLDDFCVRFARSREVVEKMYVCIEMAWYGALGNPERRAPGCLIGWPKEIEGEILLAAPERLDAPSTWKIEREILARVNQARRTSFEGDRELTGERQVERLDIFQRTMKRHPNQSFREICGVIDSECARTSTPIPLQPKCKKHCHETLVESIDCQKCRRNMKSFLSRKRRSLNLERPPASKFPIESKVTKLPKVTS